MSERRKSKPVYFTSLKINDVRCFGDRQELDLTAVDGRPARWTLILGDNGVGKTTLLQCLAWMQPVRTQVSIGKSDRFDVVLGSAITDEQDSVIESLVRKSCDELTLDARVSIGGGLWPPASGKRNRPRGISTGADIRITFNKQGQLSEAEPTKDRPRVKIKELETRIGVAFEKPLVVLYGANRHLGKVNLDDPGLVDGSDSARLSNHTELYDLDQMLSFLKWSALEPERQSEGLLNERLLEALIRILPGDFTVNDLEVLPPDLLSTGVPSGVRLKNASGSFIPLSAHSYGYQTTLAWTADLAWRLGAQYPKSQNPLTEPAVVLIDEIELHLHPLWQLEIVERLSSIFTGTQFIATSHSPLMAQVAETANIVRVRWNESEVEIVNDPHVDRRWRVDQILMSELFDVPRGRSKGTEARFRRRDELQDKLSRSATEEAELKALRAEISRLPTAQDPRDQEAINHIREAAARLRIDAEGEE